MDMCQEFELYVVWLPMAETICIWLKEKWAMSSMSPRIVKAHMVGSRFLHDASRNLFLSLDDIFPNVGFIINKIFPSSSN